MSQKHLLSALAVAAAALTVGGALYRLYTRRDDTTTSLSAKLFG